MKLFKEKLYPEIKPHIWFAWRPVWAFYDSDDGYTKNLMCLAWLENVKRCNGYKYKWHHRIITNQDDE